jgi:ribosomal protein S18 acetylase RimI-like enzyme
MQILEVESENDKHLEAFKQVEWALADREHYGDTIPDFTKRSQTLVFRDGDEIQGYVSFSLMGGVGKIDSLLVGKSFRGQGIGKQLLSGAEERMKTLGAHKVSLETGVNWIARSVYEKMGYKVRTHLPNDFGHQEFVLMDKEF